MKSDAYRTNTRAPEEVAERKSRLFDHMLYWAPLRRLLYVAQVLLPFGIAAMIGWREHGYVGDACAAAAIYALVCAVCCIPLVPTVLDNEKVDMPIRFKLLAVANGPGTVVAMLLCWIATGHHVPAVWRKKSKS